MGTININGNYIMINNFDDVAETIYWEYNNKEFANIVRELLIKQEDCIKYVTELEDINDELEEQVDELEYEVNKNNVIINSIKCILDSNVSDENKTKLIKKQLEI